MKNENLDKEVAVSPSVPLNCSTARGHWEAVPDEPHQDDARSGRFWRVRWSNLINEKYLYVKHYGGNGVLNEVMAKNDAERMNEKGRHPSEYR